MSNAGTDIPEDSRLDAFLQAFGDERKCADALYRFRWPAGFACRNCGCDKYCELRTRPVYQCNCCKNQVSLTAGTLFSSTKLPLTKWFLAIHLVMQSRLPVSGAQLARTLGVNQNTALLMKRKIVAAMNTPGGTSSLESLLGSG